MQAKPDYSTRLARFRAGGVRRVCICTGRATLGYTGLQPSRAPAFMIDIHSHILPGLDDGSRSWEMTLEMCRLASADGITHMVCTPHADETYSFNRDAVRQVVAELAARIEDRLEFSIGCDFHLSFDNIEDAIRHPRRYAIAAGAYLLVEFSDYAIPAQIREIFFRCRQRA
jgi:protein-tyrosine phosphatase